MASPAQTILNKSAAGRSAVCPVCDSPEATSAVFVLGDHDVYACRTCSAEFLYPQPSDETLGRIYTANYFIGSESEAGLKHAAELKRATAALYLRSIANLVESRNPRVLEIGCGMGDFLLEAQSRGFSVEGLEYSTDAVAKANRRLGIEAVTAGSLETHQPSESRFDLVVGFDVIEHVRSPRYAVACLQRALVPGGLIALATPSLDSWSRKALGRSWMEYKTEHLTYFNRKSLAILLEGNGFENVRFLPNYKILSIHYICEHFRLYPVPLVTPLSKLFRRLIPGWLAHRPLKVVASGTMVVARKRRA